MRLVANSFSNIIICHCLSLFVRLYSILHFHFGHNFWSTKYQAPRNVLSCSSTSIIRFWPPLQAVVGFVSSENWTQLDQGDEGIHLYNHL